MQALNLREEILQRQKNLFASSPSPYPVEKNNFSAMTYNVHRCLGMDGKFSTLCIAHAVGKYMPTLIALQECLPTRSAASGKTQVEEISAHLQVLYQLPRLASDQLPLLAKFKI